MLTITLCSIQVQIELTLCVSLCLHTLCLCHHCSRQRRSSFCDSTHTLTHRGTPKGHMLISCELNLQRRKDNRSTQLTQKRKCSLHTQIQLLHLQLKGHCSKSPLPSLTLSLPLWRKAVLSLLFSLLSGPWPFHRAPLLSPISLGRYSLS